MDRILLDIFYLVSCSLLMAVYTREANGLGITKINQSLTRIRTKMGKLLSKEPRNADNFNYRSRKIVNAQRIDPCISK